MHAWEHTTKICEVLANCNRVPSVQPKPFQSRDFLPEDLRKLAPSPKPARFTVEDLHAMKGMFQRR